MDPYTDISAFQQSRLRYHPVLPEILEQSASLKSVELEDGTLPRNDGLKTLFPLTGELPAIKLENDLNDQKIGGKPLRVGVFFSGGQAPGGHNVITGLYDALQKYHPESSLFGFLGGPSGLISGKSKPITAALLQNYQNLGGFDLLGSDRTKFETSTQIRILENVKKMDLDGLVVIGGDDSNTNAAFLAEYFLAQKCKTKVIGVPKTIDGDLKGSLIECSFGFDTASKTYSAIIGNLARDLISAKKYYYFVKLMGRSASSVTLECALQTHPNYALIGEEIAAKGLLLSDVVQLLTDLICERSKRSKEYGLILVPEGLLEFIPDCHALIKELSVIEKHHSKEVITDQLSAEAKSCFLLLPEMVQNQLLLDLDPHGNLQVSKIETERLLIALVSSELEQRKARGEYAGKFNAQPLFCGYEGRSCSPSNFDANYCYALGHVAAGLIQNNLTGYMAAVKGLSDSVSNWQPIGVPLVSLMDFEERKGVQKAVIRKALVNLKGKPYLFFKEQCDHWAYEDDYCYPGPIQYFGPKELTEQITYTLALESNR
ncbi:MAG: diphosphate--fructose-6-phosphate 1-phosphotransferase [Parachlamydiaceae bacterium]|nr:diphosphate--fructose-6-phosphate 1-phosphotransferase [Parachlamydiaceae bacterium]